MQIRTIIRIDAISKLQERDMFSQTYASCTTLSVVVLKQEYLPCGQVLVIKLVQLWQKCYGAVK